MRLDEGAIELQLISRVWRIGQTKPVRVRRFVAQGTVEERMLELRKRTKGVLAEEKDAVSAAEEVKVPAAGAPAGKQKAGGAAASESQVAVAERLEETRYLLGVEAASA